MDYGYKKIWLRRGGQGV